MYDLIMLSCIERTVWMASHDSVYQATVTNVVYIYIAMWKVTIEEVGGVNVTRDFGCFIKMY